MSFFLHVAWDTETKFYTQNNFILFFPDSVNAMICIPHKLIRVLLISIVMSSAAIQWISPLINMESSFLRYTLLEMLRFYDQR